MLRHAVLMLVALAAGLLVARLTQRGGGLSVRQRWIVAVGAVFGGALGAKLPFLLMDPEGGRSLDIWLDDGRTLTFGLVGGYLGVEVAKALAGIQVKTGDGLAAPVATAVAVGRVGCFFAGCCAGIATTLPWGHDFGDGVLRHPTQIYEALFHGAAAVLLIWMRRRGVLRLQLVKLYIAGYLVYRFGTEWIRPEPVLALGLTLYQWAAVVFVPVFAALWALDERRKAQERVEGEGA